jgi:hypothetical protein
VKSDSNSNLPGAGELVRLTSGQGTYTGVVKYHRAWFDVEPEMIGLVIEPASDIATQEGYRRWEATVLFEGCPVTVDIRAFRRLGPRAQR